MPTSPIMLVMLTLACAGCTSRHPLDKRIPAKFEEYRLIHAIAHVRNSTEADILTDWDALQQAGINQDCAIDFRSHFPKPARHVLDRIVSDVQQRATEPIAGRKIDGAYVITTSARMKLFEPYPFVCAGRDATQNQVHELIIKMLNQPVPIDIEADIFRLPSYMGSMVGVGSFTDGRSLTRISIDSNKPITLRLRNTSALTVWRFALALVSHDADERAELRIAGRLRIAAASDLPEPLPGAEPRDAIVYLRLQRRVTIEPGGTTVAVALNKFAELADVPMKVAWRDMANAGAPKNRNLESGFTDMTVAEALTALIKQVCPRTEAGAEIGWTVEDGVVRVQRQHDNKR